MNIRGVSGMNIHVHFPAIRTSHVRRLAVAIGNTVTPDTLIRIYGEVDNEMFERTKVDVKRLEVQK